MALPVFGLEMGYEQGEVFPSHIKCNFKAVPAEQVISPVVLFINMAYDLADRVNAQDANVYQPGVMGIFEKRVRVFLIKAGAAKIPQCLHVLDFLQAAYVRTGNLPSCQSQSGQCPCLIPAKTEFLGRNRREPLEGH